MTQCQSVSTFESEVQNSLSTLELCSTDSLGHQHRTKKLSPKIALHFKVLCESKAMLPYCTLENGDFKTRTELFGPRCILTRNCVQMHCF